MPEAPSPGRSKQRIARFLSIVVAAILAAAMLVPLTTPEEVEAWSTDPAANTEICIGLGCMYCTPAVVSDGAGGAIIVWEGSRYEEHAPPPAASMPRGWIHPERRCGQTTAHPSVLPGGFRQSP